MSRGLVVAVREPRPSAQVTGMVASYLQFTIEAQDESGAFHNRRNGARVWTDAHGRRPLGSRAVGGRHRRGAADGRREEALAVASLGMQARSPWPRAMAYAALGAAESCAPSPGTVPPATARGRAHPASRPRIAHGWPWPEPRLTYANAVLPEALIAIGRALNDDALLAHGLDLLPWLLDLETRDGHISVTPAAGLAPGDRLPGFDQQPIEVSALAEACWRAYAATGDPRWMDAVQLCADWFLGANDVGLTLYDRATGGGSDGLHSTRINLNQGAESTLAALSTLQLARRPALVAPR